jgi:hypothetical protein
MDTAIIHCYTALLGFVALAPTGITRGRAEAMVAAAVGLISVIVGALARVSAGRQPGSGRGRAGAIVALVLGFIGMILSLVHLGRSTGGFGTGGGRAGAIVALVLALVGMTLGGLALARAVRARKGEVAER